MYIAAIQGSGFTMSRQFRLQRDAASQCERWAASYNGNGQIHAFGFPEIGYLAFETEPGIYGNNICGVVRISMYRAVP